MDSGRDLYFPGLRFQTSGQLRITHDGQVLEGPGRIVSTSDRVFEITAPVADLRIEGLTLENLGAPAGGVDAAVALYTEEGAGLERAMIRDLTLIGFGIAMSLSGTDTVSFHDPVVGPGGRNTITGCRIHSTRATTRVGSGGGHAIYVRGGYFQILGNQIEGMQGGILAPTHGVVSGNVILNAWDDNGIYVTGGRDLSITGNYIENTKADGIAVSYSSGVTISGNTVVNAGNAAIRIQASHLVTVTGNVLRAGPGTNHFIRGFADPSIPGSSEVVVNANVMEGPTSGVSMPVYFGAGSTPHRGLSVIGNTFTQLDTSSLSGGFFGPYAIVKFFSSAGGEPCQACQVVDNVFTDIVQAPGAPDSLIRGADRVEGNRFVYR